MMIPDYALVAEVMLFSEGFEEAKALSRKMVQLYKLASEQLSQQVGVSGTCHVSQLLPAAAVDSIPGSFHGKVFSFPAHQVDSIPGNYFFSFPAHQGALL
jgi:hypothetical protein